MNAEKHGRGVEQADQALELFASVGAHSFDLTHTDLDGHKWSFSPAQKLDLLRRALPELLESAIRRHHNLIVRPRGATAGLVQLDDLSGAVLERLEGCAFLILTTSPENHQAWIAVQQCDPDLARHLRLGNGADPSASGATRLPGSLNYKRKYAPAFPLVRIRKATPQLVVTRFELEALDLVAPAAASSCVPPARVSVGRPVRPWPSYERCLQRAPLTHQGDRPDVSRADFTFCMIAIDWGWSLADTCARLLETSSKARENGRRYAQLTVQRAAAAVLRRRSLTDLPSRGTNSIR